MKGAIGSAVLVVIISIFLIRRFDIKTMDGDTIKFHPKVFNKG